MSSFRAAYLGTHTAPCLWFAETRAFHVVAWHSALPVLPCCSYWRSSKRGREDDRRPVLSLSGLRLRVSRLWGCATSIGSTYHPSEAITSTQLAACSRDGAQSNIMAASPRHVLHGIPMAIRMTMTEIHAFARCEVARELAWLSTTRRG